MTDDFDKAVDGEEAARLLASPVLKRIWDEYERELLERALAAPARDNEGRQNCLTAITILRKIRERLESKKFDARKAANDVAETGEANEKRRWF
jgi:hypothetical protein